MIDFLRIKRKLCLFLTVLFLSLIVGCSSVKKVNFENPVDTTKKNIKIETKKVYELVQNSTYASSDFDGARLNDFKYKNDSTALVIINPENSPINQSPYYAFKAWSRTSKFFYFEFQYPSGFKHRYIPKLKIDNRWNRIDTLNIFKKDSIITIKVKLNKNPILIAAQEIHNSTNVKEWYTSLTKNKENYVRTKSVGKSVLGRNLPVLDIYKKDNNNKDIIVLLTRQHPPEVTGYFAFQNFLETILNGS